MPDHQLQLRTFRGRVVLAVPGHSSRDRITVVDRHGRALSAPVGEVDAYVGPEVVIPFHQFETFRRMVEGLPRA